MVLHATHNYKNALCWKKLTKSVLPYSFESVYQSAVTYQMDHNASYKHQVSFRFDMTHHLHELVPPFTVYFSIKNAPKSESKTFL